MMIYLLLLIAGIHGAAIPPQPQIPTTSQCLRDCFEVGSLVNAAFDLTNFKSIAVDIENFCRINSALLKCGRECPEEQMAELEARTQASSFACSEKVEEFRLVSECLENAPNVVEKCSSDCRFPSDHAPIRLDSSPAALVNPTVFLDGIGDTCQKHLCIVKCSITDFNKACSGSGDLFKDVARQQVMMGEQRLAADSSNENQTTVQMMTLNYLHNLPKECMFMKDASAYDKAVQISESDENMGSEMTTMSAILENERDSKEKPTEAEKEKDIDVTTQDTTNESKNRITTSSTFEFEPNNDPEVPVGPPEVGATVEPTHAVEGPVETDEEIIDSEGRTTTRKISMVDSSASMATEESIEGTTIESIAEEEAKEMVDTIVKGTTEMNNGDSKIKEKTAEKKTSDEMSSELDATTPHEPVIVIEDSARKEGENNIIAGGVEEVKSTNYVPAAAFLPSLAAVIAFILCL